MQLKEHIASPRIVLLSNDVARYRFGSHMRIMIPIADAEMMREALEESGSWCKTRMAIELATVPNASARSRIPIAMVPSFSNLLRSLGLYHWGVVLSVCLLTVGSLN